MGGEEAEELSRRADMVENLENRAVEFPDAEFSPYMGLKPAKPVKVYVPLPTPPKAQLAETFEFERKKHHTDILSLEKSFKEKRLKNSWNEEIVKKTE
jgi:hypothetical protein